MKKVLSFLLCFSLSVKVLEADQIKLVDASVEAAAAYFSAVTGNAYVVNFDSEASISVQQEVSNPSQSHDLFVTLIESLNGKIVRSGDQSYIILDNVQSDDIVHNQSEPLIKTENQIVERLFFLGRISLNSLRTMAENIPKFKSIKIVPDDNSSKSALLIGDKKLIFELKNVVTSLKPLSSGKPSKIQQTDDNFTFQTSNVEAEKENISSTTIVSLDLNFADASELVEALSMVLLNGESANGVKISAHSSGNQLILSGSEDAVSAAIDVIRKLDRAPRQVYVDAIIAEVSEGTSKKLGLQFSVQNNNLAGSVVTGVQTPNIGSLASDAFLAGATGGMIAIGNGASSVPDIGLLLSALQGDTDNRILSTPSLMAAENKESVILVGQNVPFVTGQFLPETGTGQSPFQTIKREDLGTKLKLKPRIGLKNDITLEVWQEVSRIDQNATGLTDVVTVKREITTVISAKHGETVAIGGLRVEQEEMAISKVPFLGDIPGIGNLFRQETVNSVSRNLVIFLRPRLVSSEHQREHMLNVWKNDLGLDLYEYEEQKLMMSSPDPIGGRMQIETLRPKVRPTGN